MVKTIEELIEKYNEYISLLEEDIRREGIGNGFRVGRRSAFCSVVDDLEELSKAYKLCEKCGYHIGNWCFRPKDYICEALSQEPCDTYTEGYFKGYDDGLERKLDEPCEDAVSREAVLQAVSEGCQEWRGIYGRCEELINELPSVTQKSGKWINDKDDMPTCSKCGYIPPYSTAIDDYEYSNYCPSCGAKMESEEQTE